MTFLKKFIDKVKNIFFLIKNIKIKIGYNIEINNNGKIELGSNVSISKGCIISVKKNCSLFIDDNVFIGKDTEIDSRGKLLIGENTTIQSRANIFGDIKIFKNCIFGPNVYLSSDKHTFFSRPYELINKQQNFLIEKYSSPIVVNEDCFIGINVFIRPGITIGRGCIVGANSNVTKDLEPYSIAVGNPAKVIKKRLSFLPPDVINCDDPKDIPYFYKGFIRKKKNGQEETILRDNTFVISLNLFNKNKIILEIFSDFDSNLIMNEKNIKKSFLSGHSTLEFLIEGLKEKFINFECINFSRKNFFKIIKAKAI